MQCKKKRKSAHYYNKLASQKTDKNKSDKKKECLDKEINLHENANIMTQRIIRLQAWCMPMVMISLYKIIMVTKGSEKDNM